MFDDEDYDDYFLDEDEGENEPARRPQTPTYNSHSATPRAGETINFGNGHENHEPETDRSEGCMNGVLRRLGCGCLAAVLIAIIVGGAIGYFRYLTPTVEDAVMDVNVLRVEKRGTMFKTYEAEVADPSALAGASNDAYTRMRAVSVANESVARKLQDLQSTGRTVRLRYCQYASTLPWRGESKTVITEVLPSNDQ